MQNLKTFFEEGRIKKGSWLSLPVENRVAEVSSLESGTRTKQTFTTDGLSEVCFQFTGEYDKVAESIKCIGKIANFKLELEGILGYNNGTYILNNICHTLFGLDEYDIMSHNIAKDEYDILCQNVSIEELIMYSQFTWLSTQYEIYDQCAKHFIRGLWGIYSYKAMEISLYCYSQKENFLNPAPATALICPMQVIPINKNNIKVFVDENHTGKSQNSPYKVVLD
ncbi:MAG: hypothetical protein K2H53_04195 [Clostridia bacterium]|nr:hypothetical protein [Clostridia bacterium]